MADQADRPAISPQADRSAMGYQAEPSASPPAGVVGLSPLVVLPYYYQPLNSTVDSIRLLILEPAETTKGPVVCRLQHVTFGEKPKYEALSYTWGDDTKKRSITMNGRDVLIGINLHKALVNVRDPRKERIIWADAVCINQKDVKERTAQIKIMPYIYQRAQTVLVCIAERPSGPTFTKPKAKSEPPYDLSPEWLEQICSNGYWKRVWIVQEISLARNIVIYCGQDVVPWEQLIAALESSGRFEGSPPIMFQKGIDNKYTDGHKLQTLLENHQKAMCKEPRDKIYGFVGLAVDCVEGYPMDYQKSLFEVWKDAVLFRNSELYADQRDIMQFAKLVQNVLGGSEIVTKEEVEVYSNKKDRGVEYDVLKLGSIQRTTIRGRMKLTSKTTSQTSFFLEDFLLIPSRFAGQIISLGPTSKEIISDLSKTGSWRASIDCYVDGSQRPSAREESDNFIRTLEEADEGYLQKIGSSYRPGALKYISWKLKEIPSNILSAEMKKIPTNGRTFSELGFDSDDKGEPKSSSSLHPKLFLLGGANNHAKPSGIMGLAPRGVQVGDFVCQVQGMEAAIIVRREDHVLSIIGTAALAESSQKARARRKGDVKTKLKFDTADFDDFPTEDRVDLYMDIASAYLLLD